MEVLKKLHKEGPNGGEKKNEQEEKSVSDWLTHVEFFSTRIIHKCCKRTTTAAVATKLHTSQQMKRKLKNKIKVHNQIERILLLSVFFFIFFFIFFFEENVKTTVATRD